MDKIEIAEAKELQKNLAKQVVLNNEIPEKVTFIAGMDVSHVRFDEKKMIYAAAILLSYPALTVFETAESAEKQLFPYIPGLLGFREAPALINAFKKLKVRPDLIMVDGHGVSHPRRLGIASHIGVLLDIPTIGVAKKILVGKPEKPLPEEAGSLTPLIWKGDRIGMLVRTKKRCSPLIVSAGHKIELETAIEWVFRCQKRYRLPECTRQAHFAANQYRIRHQTFELTNRHLA